MTPGKIEWDDTQDKGVAPNGTTYALVSDGARGEGRAWVVWVSCPNGWRKVPDDSYTWPTKRYAKALAQRHYDGRLRPCP